MIKLRFSSNENRVIEGHFKPNLNYLYYRNECQVSFKVDLVPLECQPTISQHNQFSMDGMFTIPGMKTKILNSTVYLYTPLHISDELKHSEF